MHLLKVMVRQSISYVTTHCQYCPPKRLDLGKGYPQSGLPFPAQKPSMRQCPTIRRQHGGPFGEDPAQSHQRKSRATHHSSIPVAGGARLERRESHVSQFPRRNSTRMLMRGRQPFRSRPHSAVSPRSRSGQTYVSSHRRRQRRMNAGCARRGVSTSTPPVSGDWLSIVPS